MFEPTQPCPHAVLYALPLCLRMQGVNVSQPITVQVYVWMFSDQGRAVIATALPIQASPNPVQLTGAPGCCSVQLAVGDVQLTNKPVSRCATAAAAAGEAAVGL